MADEYICELVHHGNGLWDYEPTGKLLVRCKDCKHLHINEYGQWCEGGFVHELSPIENDDFCSRGEMKEE